jgi:hypothetical protein
MRKNKKNQRRTHSCTLLVEREGFRSETGVFTTLILGSMLEKAKKAGMSVIGTRHSKYCLCGDGNNEIVLF